MTPATAFWIACAIHAYVLIGFLVGVWGMRLSDTKEMPATALGVAALWPITIWICAFWQIGKLAAPIGRLILRCASKLALVVAVLSGAAACDDHALYVRVLSVYDGDTFTARWPSGEVRHVRVRGVDAPEMKGQCDAEKEGAIRARDRARALLGDRVELRKLGIDKYGRTLAIVVLTDGRTLDGVLVSEGLGRPYHGERRMGWCS